MAGSRRRCALCSGFAPLLVLSAGLSLVSTVFSLGAFFAPLGEFVPLKRLVGNETATAKMHWRIRKYIRHVVPLLSTITEEIVGMNMLDVPYKFIGPLANLPKQQSFFAKSDLGVVISHVRDPTPVVEQRLLTLLTVVHALGDFLLFLVLLGQLKIRFPEFRLFKEEAPKRREYIVL